MRHHPLKPGSGEIRLGGRNLEGLPPHRIARMGVAIKNQIPSVYGGLSVRENVWLAARRAHHGRALETMVARALAEIDFDTEDRASAKVDALSHAHRQWVELGMLLVTEPKLALLDEPTAGMTRGEMLKTVRIIQRLNEHSTIIVVEHDLEFISLLAKRVTVLHRGRVLVEDTMERITQNQAVREIYLGSQWQPPTRASVQ